MKLRPEEEDLWADILNDVSTASLNKDRKSLVVFGDECVGKSSLINRFRRTDGHGIKQGLGLEYSFLDIRDQFSDDIVSRLSIWTINSDEGTLQYTLSDHNLRYTDKGWSGMALLVVDYSRPWSILERLQHWVGVLDRHIESLKIDAGERKDVCGKLAKSLQEYCLPGTEINKDVLLPLTEGVLDDNLGIPMAVVCTKVDCMTTLEKELDYTDADFDLIQWHVRRFCLKYGAGLFYVNGKESPNTDILYKYVVHKMYQSPFEVAPTVVDKDSLMIPAGWDTRQKISILNDTLRAFNLEEDIGTVLSKPLTRSDTLREVKAEDDQAFLTRMQSLLQNQRPSGNRPKPLSNQPSRTALPTSTAAGGAAGGAPGNDGVLANFFNSLLNKKPSPGASGPTPRAGAAPRTGAGGGPPRANNPNSPRVTGMRQMNRSQSEGVTKPATPDS